MKTMKFVLMIAFVAFATMTFASDGPDRNQLVVKISLEKAILIKSLKTEMLQQLTPDFLNEEKPGLYFVRVRYMNNDYIIYGKYKEWKLFFSLSGFKVAYPVFGKYPDFSN